MVKPHLIRNDLESTAVDAIRALLKHVPNIQIIRVLHEQQLASGYRLDARIDFGHDEIRYALLIEIKSNGAPRFARSAVYQLESYIAHLHRSEHQDVSRRFIPMLVSSYLSPESRSICLDHNVAYLDLYGNRAPCFRQRLYRAIRPRQTEVRNPSSAVTVHPRRQAQSCGFSFAIRLAHGASPIWLRQPTPASDT